MRLPLEATSLGSARVRVTLEGPEGLAIVRDYDVPVKPAAPNVSRRTVQTLAARSGTLTVSSDLAADLIPETVKVAVNVGQSAALDVPGLLLALDRFPVWLRRANGQPCLAPSVSQRSGRERRLAGEDRAREARIRIARSPGCRRCRAQAVISASGPQVATTRGLRLTWRFPAARARAGPFGGGAGHYARAGPAAQCCELSPPTSAMAVMTWPTRSTFSRARGAR